MIIKAPTPEDQPRLRQLWKEAFGDEDSFLDLFFSTAFHPQRCLCALWSEDPVAAIYWFDCTLRGEKVAYLYALATFRSYQGRGIARQLLAHTHAYLKDRGYKAALLVPGSKGLAAWYETMDYAFCGGITEFSCEAAGEPARLRPLSAEEYGFLREQYLPEGSVIHSAAALDFLAGQARLYAGDRCLLAVLPTVYGTVVVPEFLGSPAEAPGILAALGYPKAAFRTPGAGRSLAMYRPLTVPFLSVPTYFALAFD